MFTCLIGCVPLVGHQENESEESRDGSREGEGQEVFPDPGPVQILVHQESHKAKSCKKKSGISYRKSASLQALTTAFHMMGCK